MRVQVDKLLTGSGLERDLTLMVTIFHCPHALFVYISITNVSSYRPVRLTPTDWTRRNFKLSTANPSRLLFIRNVKTSQ
jgi:hypothetical protein